MKHRDGCKYKICIRCGLEWNVSVKDKYKYYICPVCRAKIKRGENNAGSNDTGKDV